ncbi:response regulator transcription factor [Gammaproteobacteria bacterium]|nr:response regulator transcription factor [Gammaproteobacteria bacterium]
MRILVVEDDVDLASQLSDQLRSNGYAVDHAADGIDGVYYGQEYPIDLAIVDIGLPGKDGLQVVREIRESEKTYPILVLTARDRWDEKVAGLDAGADDYMVKPFHIEELLARINALMRRVAGSADNRISCGKIILDPSSQEVRVDDKLVALTAYEYRLLHYMMLNKRRVLSKLELTEHIYDEDTDRDSNVIEVFIGRLRRKLDPDNNWQPIHTLRGRGYRLEDSE